MVSILQIGDMRLKYQYHFDDYLDESVKRYQTSNKSFDWGLYVELTEVCAFFDLDFKVTNKRFHYVSEQLEVVTVYHDVEKKIYSQQIVFDKIKKEAFIRLNPKYVKDLAMQEYVLSGVIFLEMAVMQGFIALHASAISYQDEAILFSAPSTTGKSTQAKLWQQFDPGVEIINDDKPLIYHKDNKFYVTGSPFSGKTQENLNKTIPLKTILFLVQGKSNVLNKLSNHDKVKQILINSMKPKNKDAYELYLSQVEKLIKLTPIYEFQATKDLSAVTFIHKNLYKELKIMKIKKEYILKEVANQYIVVPTGKETINFNGMLTLNNTAKMLFEALQEDREIHDLVSLLQQHYDLEHDQALIDVKDFIKVLESKNILE